MLISALALALSPACSDEKSAKDKCVTLASDTCEALDDCGLIESLSECKRDMADALQCDDAVGTGRDYGECLDDVADNSCEDWDPESPDVVLPSSCDAVILIDD